MRDELTTFSQNIKTYMEYYQLTQTDLADRLDVAQAAVSKWIRGVAFPRIGKIDEMCTLFHCSRSDLIERQQSPETISRKILMNNLLAKIDTLNDAGLEKLISTIDDLSERFLR